MESDCLIVTETRTYDLIWSNTSSTFRFVPHLYLHGVCTQLSAGCLANKTLSFSPPARWGLLDFITAACRPLPSASFASVSSSHLLLFAAQIPVGTAGLHPRAPDPSGHCRTSSASSRSQWALPDFSRELQIAEGTAGLQPVYMPDWLPERLSNRMPEKKLDRMPERMRQELRGPNLAGASGPESGRIRARTRLVSKCFESLMWEAGVFSELAVGTLHGELLWEPLPW